MKEWQWLWIGIALTFCGATLGELHLFWIASAMIGIGLFLMLMSPLMGKDGLNH